jgi:hypothetical protein
VAEEFKLEPDELQKVSNGLRDIESRMKARMSTLRGQLGAEGTPWQFPGGPAGVEANLENAESSVDPSMTGGVADLADYLQKIVNTFQESEG